MLALQHKVGVAPAAPAPAAAAAETAVGRVVEARVAAAVAPHPEGRVAATGAAVVMVVLVRGGMQCSCTTRA